MKDISDGDLGRFLSFARKTALGAGKILITRARKHNRIEFKGRVNLVTAADLASEKFIIQSIEKRFPHHSRLAEEVSSLDKGSEFKWIIDPLDGTTNFAHSFPFYCVSIALEYRGEVLVGVIFDPERKEMFYASKGNGAYLNRSRIAVTSESNLTNALLATGFPYDIGTSSENNLSYFSRFARISRGVRRAGSAALDLCYVACGRFDGFWELKLSPWDTAAGILIVEEAGGKVTDFRGKEFSIYGRHILATNGKIHTQMRRIIASC